MSSRDSSAPISDVSDTALWVAVYRAQETERPDALFRDPYAGRLAGERGKMIASKMVGSRFTAWSITTRTAVIDAMITKLVTSDVDLVVNLGAGLDSRPYRMKLPPSLIWVEVDYEKIIEHKKRILSEDRPTCDLRRFSVDLADAKARRDFLNHVANEIASDGKTVLVLTEGVIPYLSETQVAELARDLRTFKNIRYWIADYYSEVVKKHMLSPKRLKLMKNAPFQFFPKDWFGFFENLGWTARESRYLGEESLKLGRGMPLPWYVRFMKFLIPRKAKKEALRYSAYVLLENTRELDLALKI